MIKKDSEISLTYTLGGESLVRPGVYKSAIVSVKNSFAENEIFKSVEPMKTIERAVYKKATINVKLGTAFIAMALEQPKKPEGMNFHKWLRSPLGKISQNWKKLSNEERIHFHIEQYVQDMGGEDFNYKIL